MLVDLIRVPDPKTIDDLLDEPLGLLYLAAALRRAGHQVRITNLAGRGATGWAADLQPADLYGLQLYTPTAALGAAIAGELKRRFPGVPVLAGGAHPSAVPDAPELAVFDTVVTGEGERAIVELAKRATAGEPLPRRYRGEPDDDLDAIPFPARELIAMDQFHRTVDGERCFGIIGSRGCCFHCAFCDQALFGSRIRFRSTDNIVAEIRAIRDRHGVRHLEFFDDMWAVNKARLRSFRDQVRGLDLAYRCNARTDVHDPEIYQLLAESGARVVCFGIESGSQRMLDRMKKETTVGNAHRAIELAHQAGLIVIGYFIIGFPGETVASIDETLAFIRDSGLDQAQAYTFVPLPGCDVFRHPEAYGIRAMVRDWREYYLVMGHEGLGGRTIDTEWLGAAELEAQVRRVRAFLRERPTRGKLQAYYTRQLNYRPAE